MRYLFLLFALLLATPAQANSMEEALCERPSAAVELMKSSEKFCRSFVRALRQLPESTAREASVLLSEENLALMVVMTSAWAGTQGIPVVGQAVDAALLSLGVILATAQSAALTDSLWRYADLTSTARSFAELDAAAAHLSRVISAVGVNIVAFLLTRKLMGPGSSSGPGAPLHLVEAKGLAATAVLPIAKRPSLQAPALTMASGGPRRPSSVEPASAKVPKRVDQQAFTQWIQRARKRPTRSAPASYRYQQQQAGPEELLVEGGGEHIWADGFRLDSARLVESKFIETPEKSPFIAGSKCNENIRRWIHQELMEEFRRYAAIIAAPETPVVGLEVVTNDARAITFFESLLRSFEIPGEVVVKP